jgi:hypothetical protein
MLNYVLLGGYLGIMIGTNITYFDLSQNPSHQSKFEIT